MLHKCVVGGCPNRSDTIIHYMLPEDPKRRSLWLKFIEDSKADGQDATSSCRVCGDHFSEENYFKMDLGYTTCMILSVDAVPTVHTVSPPSETEREIEETEVDESVEDDTCRITISEAVSLACVKEEPFEYELSTNMTPGQEQNSSLDDSVKYEENELAVSEDGISTVIFGVKESHGRKFISCLTCGQRFRSKRNLMKHRRATHTKKNTESEVKDRFYVCSICGERFHQMSLLLRHRALHTKENPEGRFVCRQCGKGFPHQAFLKAHQKVHEDAESAMPFTCHLCPRRFGYKVALVAHMKHHSSKLICACPVCEKSFQFRGSLVQHLKSSHAGEKLVCTTCDKGFLRVNGYVKHMDKHNVMTPFYCDICQIYFSQRGYAAHMLTHEQKSLPEQHQLDESVEDQLNDTEISLVSVNSSEEGMDPVTVGEEEAGMEALSEDEMEDLSGSSMDPSTVEDVESENMVVEKELAQDNHEEKEKSEDSSGTQ